jgi:hypothetical protein
MLEPFCRTLCFLGFSLVRLGAFTAAAHAHELGIRVLVVVGLVLCHTFGRTSEEETTFGRPGVCQKLISGKWPINFMSLDHASFV